MVAITQSVTQQVQDWLVSRPAVAACLHDGIINYSALARLIEADTKAHPDAIVTALRRIRDDRSGSGHEAALRGALKASRVEMRTHVALLTYATSWDLLGRLSDALKALGEEERVHVFHGWEDLRVVADEALINDLRKAVGPAEPLEECSGLVELNIRSEAADVPGFLASVTSALAAQSVNVLDAASCRRDHIFLVEGDDLAVAIAALDSIR